MDGALIPGRGLIANLTSTTTCRTNQFRDCSSVYAIFGQPLIYESGYHGNYKLINDRYQHLRPVIRDRHSSADITSRKAMRVETLFDDLFVRSRPRFLGHTIKTSGLGASSAPFLCMFPDFGACWHNSGTVPQAHTVYPRNLRPCAILVVEDA